MAKDPAFLFYSQDFYTGVATLNWEDRGKYISLICLMHQQGRMTEETIRFLVGSVSDNLKSKFRIDDNGLWYNERLEVEAEKRNNFTESRRLNGNLGGRPKESKANGKAINNHKVKLVDNHKANLMEDENENDISVLNNKKESFKNEVFEVGGLIYTEEMLTNFFEKWTEPGKGTNPKLKFEKEKTWSTELRLKTWARNNYDNIICFLGPQKTIKQKQQELKDLLRPFNEQKKYTPETLNAFYGYWSMPENKPEPLYIRWELEEFWDLGKRLNSWKESPLNKGKEEEKVVYQIPK